MSSKDSTKTRRAFLGNLALTGVGSIIAGTVINTTFSLGQDGAKKPLATITIAEEKDLATVGGNVLIKDTPQGDILIVRSSEKEYSAMSNICPHKECKVKVKSADLIQCPCHRSAYKLDGTYIQGPSKKSLAQFSLTVKDGVIIVYNK